MNYQTFFENYLESKFYIKTEKRPSRWNEHYGTNLTDTIYYISFPNGAKAMCKDSWEFANEDYSKPPSQRTMIIIRWDATPFSEIMDKGLNAEKDYKGKGFASKVMSILLGICKKEGIDYMGIWAPTKDSQAVMNNYVQKNILIPEKWSKAELDDYYTRFKINWPVAETRIS